VQRGACWSPLTRAAGLELAVHRGEGAEEEEEEKDPDTSNLFLTQFDKASKRHPSVTCVLMLFAAGIPRQKQVEMRVALRRAQR